MNDRDEILLVEDSARWQEELTMLIEEAGFVPQVASTADEATALLGQRSAKAAVMDVSLAPGDASDRSGLDIMRTLRIPVVLVSAYLSPGEENEALARGRARAVFSKSDLHKHTDRFVDAVRRAVSAAALDESERWHALERTFAHTD